MSDNVKVQDGKNSGEVGLDARANILQATFKHYFEMAMDHHTKAATVSNFLLVIVGVIVSLHLETRIGSAAERVVGVAVFVIGMFGMAWTWKQHERYYFWQHIAYKYQNELKELVPELKIGRAYYQSAEDAAAKIYTHLFAKKIHERWLWVSLHGVVAAIGIWLMAHKA